MSNKRDLKRTINYVCRELFAEVVAISLYSSKKNNPLEQELLTTIIITRNDFIKRVSHPEPGITPKQYFKHLITDFEQRVSDIIDQIQNLG